MTPNTSHTTISVAHNNGHYPVFIGDNIVHDIIPSLLLPPHVVVISDSHLPEKLILSLNHTFSQLNIKATIIPIPGGEDAKTFTTFTAVSEIILEHQINRSTPIIAVGGGSIGDLAGFISASLLRGLPLFHIPTTLLAMVDSSIGGKTGINSRHGKNLIGAIHPPQAVIIDTLFLPSLPKRHFISAYAEILKYALIQNAPLFAFLDKNIHLTLKRDPLIVKDLISASVRAKKQIVEADENEKGGRALLNLGHTFGHALETIHTPKLSHGEAVSIGIILAFRYALSLNLIQKDTLLRVSKHIATIGLPLNIPPLTNPNTMINLMKKDKKNQPNSITLILPQHNIGHVSIHNNIDPVPLRSFLEECIHQPLPLPHHAP